ncbi:hypothetical protein MMPV_005086 [Pyropia vietnamensis]
MAESLPAKEAAQFKHVVHLYEMKQLKKSIKTADTILRKFPGHGETLAMKGLAFSALGRKEEAYALVRRGLAAAMSSHVCWHVFGLLYRSDREYHAAAKAYLNALRLDSSNAQILRDLALLQVHIRDFPGLLETRHHLLMSKPGLRIHWAGLAVANHLSGDTATAVRVIDSYISSFKDSESADPDSDYQASEVVLYKAMLLEEGGDLAATVAHLDSVRGVVVDSVQWRERRARVLHRLGRFVAAEADLRHLLDLNPDNRAYHRALHAAVAAQHAELSGGGAPPADAASESTSDDAAPPLYPSPLECLPGSVASIVLSGVVVPTSPAADDAADVRRVVRLSDALSRRHQRSLLCRRLPLEVLDGSSQDFFARLDAYVRPLIVKGVPSTFSDIKPLYADPTKVAAITRLFALYSTALDATGELPPPVGEDTIGTQPEGPLRAPMVDTIPIRGADDAESEVPAVDISAAVGRVSVGDDATANGTAHGDGDGNGGTAAAKHVSLPEPGVKLWVRHFISQHLDAVGEYEAAIAVCEDTIAAWPTVVEPRLVHARVLKHAGNLSGATNVADSARRLDLSDRYVNTKAVKAALRAGRLADAAGWISLFTRDGDSGGAQALYDMQVSWFENSMADGLYANGDVPRALKHYRAVLGHFDDIEEDQFDFHTYCLRKMTLVSYISLLRMEDSVRCHAQYGHAARGAIRCLLTLADMPVEQRKAGGSASLMPDGATDLTPAERKKALSKMKKRVARGRATHASTHEPADTTATATVAADGKGGGNKKEDDAKDEGGKKKAGHGGAATTKGWMDTDPSGEEHVKSLTDPVAACVPLVMGLEKAFPNDVRTHTAAVVVALRRHKPLLALRGLLRARAIDACHPDAVRATLLFRMAVAGGGPAAYTPPGTDVSAFVAAGGDAVALPSGGGTAPTLVSVHPDVATVLRAELAASAMWPSGDIAAHAAAVVEAATKVATSPADAAHTPVDWVLASTLVTVAETAGIDAVGGVNSYVDAVATAVAGGAGNPRPLAALFKRVKAQRVVSASAVDCVVKACHARFPRSDLFAA